MGNITKNDITCVILAGGRGIRAGGVDKGLLLFKQQPLISYVVFEASKIAHRLLISANRNIKQYQQFGEVISDDLDDFQGPLAGISKAISVTKTPYLLVLPCDSPFIDDKLIMRLVATMVAQKTDICVAADGVNIYPVIALIKTNLADNLLDFLSFGQRKSSLWIEQNNFIKVDLSDKAKCLTNFNSKQDFISKRPLY